MPPVEIPLQVVPIPLVRHLSVLTLLQAVELMPNHCTVLSFVSTILDRLFSFCSKQFCVNKKVFSIKMIFALCEGNKNSTLLVKLLE